MWDYFSRPEGAVARERGNRAMVGAEPILHGGLIYDYDWTKHGESATIVDVGAGMGGAAIELTRRFPNLRVVMQDKPEVIESARKVREFVTRKNIGKLNELHPFSSGKPMHRSVYPEWRWSHTTFSPPSPPISRDSLSLQRSTSSASSYMIGSKTTV